MAKNLKLLFDADMFVFESCASIETPINWGGDLWTLHADAADAKAQIDSKVSFIVDKILTKLQHTGTYEIIMCFSDTENFRKKILPTYKANRIGKRKPVCYQAVKEWVTENYTTYQRPNLEADDCLGILATSTKEQAVIISGDKDFKSIPCFFYDHRKAELYEISEEEANKNHLLQTLAGDVADNYTGCPSIGMITATKLLDKSGYTFEQVVKIFESKGLTEEDALRQARVARILRASDYNKKKKEVILWNP